MKKMIIACAVLISFVHQTRTAEQEIDSQSLSVLSEHTDLPYTALSCDPSTNTIAVGTTQAEVVVLDSNTQKVKFESQTCKPGWWSTPEICSVHVNKSLVAALDTSCNIRVWDIHNQEKICQLERERTKKAKALHLSSDNRNLVFAGGISRHILKTLGIGYVTTYSLNNNNPLQSSLSNRFSSPIITAKWSPHSDRIALGQEVFKYESVRYKYYGCLAYILSRQQGKYIAETKGPSSSKTRTTAVAWHPNGSCFASAHPDESLVRLWDTENDTYLIQKEFITQQIPGVTTIGFSPSGSLFASGSPEMIYMFNSETKALVATTQAQCNSLAFIAEGRIASVENRKLAIYSLGKVPAGNPSSKDPESKKNE